MKEDWKTLKIEDICEILDAQRKPVSKKDRHSGCYPYYGATGIQDYVDAYLFDGRYLLVGEDGAKWGASDRTAFIVEGKCWVNNHAHILKLNHNVVDTFVEYYLTFKDLNEYITGAIVPKLTQQALRGIPIPLPPLPEQECIVAELDCLSEVIEKQKQQLKELDNLAQAIFYDMFGDPITNEKGWEVKKLGDICEGKKKIARASKHYLETDTIHYIDISSIDNNANVITETTTYIYGEAPSRAQQVVELGDILISLVRPNLRNIAMITLQDDKLVASSGFCVLRAGTKSSARFIKYFAISERFTAYLMDRVSGANYPAVREDDIRECIIGVPPLSLQQEFASKIEAIEKQKELIKQSLSETETLFNSRMDYYFN